MKVRRLGNSGLKVSVVGLGCNNFGMRIDAAQTQAVVDAAIEAGITLFDTADIYGGTKSEEFRKAHARAGNESTGPLYLEHPKFEGFEVVQTQRGKSAAA